MKRVLLLLIAFLPLFDAAQAFDLQDLRDAQQPRPAQPPRLTQASDSIPWKSIIGEADYLDSMTIKGIGSSVSRYAWLQHRTTKEVYECGEYEYEFMGHKSKTDMTCKVLSRFAPNDERGTALALAKILNADAYDMRFSMIDVLDSDPPFSQVIFFYLLVDKNKNVITCRRIRTNYEFSYRYDDGFEVFIHSYSEKVSKRKCKQVSR